MSRGGRTVTLDVAFIHCEQQLGSSWVYAPLRWGTSDGCVPHGVVWSYFRTLPMGRARVALDTARGIGLAFGSEAAGDRARQQAVDDLLPREE